MAYIQRVTLALMVTEVVGATPDATLTITERDSEGRMEAHDVSLQLQPARTYHDRGDWLRDTLIEVIENL